MLATELKAIIYHPDIDYYIPVHNLIDIPTTEMLDLAASSLMLYQRSKLNCPLSLIEGTLDNIKLHCRYHLINTPLIPNVFRLNDHYILLSNISEATVHCPYKNISYSFIPKQIQTVLTLPCGCVLHADYFMVFSE